MGISNYLELVRCLGWLFLIMFILGTPSLAITFLSNPFAASEAEAAAGPLGALRCGPQS